MNEANFQHILRVLNTNLDGKVKIMFALTSIRGVGRRFSNICCKKAEVDTNKRCAAPACAAPTPPQQRGPVAGAGSECRAPGPGKAGRSGAAALGGAGWWWAERASEGRGGAPGASAHTCWPSPPSNAHACLPPRAQCWRADG